MRARAGPWEEPESKLRGQFSVPHHLRNTKVTRSFNFCFQEITGNKMCFFFLLLLPIFVFVLPLESEEHSVRRGRRNEQGLFAFILHSESSCSLLKSQGRRVKLDRILLVLVPQTLGPVQ